MNNSNLELRAMVSQCDDYFEAQLLELDIAVAGKDIDAVLHELEHAIVSSYEIARDLGQAPFAGICPSPFYRNGQHSKSTHGHKVGVINLPDQVGEALATAMHELKPIRQLTVYSRAA